MPKVTPSNLQAPEVLGPAMSVNSSEAHRSEFDCNKDIY